MPCRISSSSVAQFCTNRSIGIDFVQEKFMGQGKQDNESAIEQAKDGQIADFIRGQYKSATGSDFPIKDKKNSFN
jgi:ERCC4-related helicase